MRVIGQQYDVDVWVPFLIVLVLTVGLGTVMWAGVVTLLVVLGIVLFLSVAGAVLGFLADVIDSARTTTPGATHHKHVDVPATRHLHVDVWDTRTKERRVAREPDSVRLAEWQKKALDRK
jgi:hypothetical protein